MLSVVVVIPIYLPALPVARTLAALVPLLVHGLVRDVHLATPTSDKFGALADQAGCALVEGKQAIPHAIAMAREPWQLVLQAGFAPEAGFSEEAEDFIAAGKNVAGILRQKPAGWVTRLLPNLAMPVGVLATRDILAALDQQGYTRIGHGLAPRANFLTRARSTA